MGLTIRSGSVYPKIMAMGTKKHAPLSHPRNTKKRQHAENEHTSLEIIGVDSHIYQKKSILTCERQEEQVVMEIDHERNHKQASREIKCVDAVNGPKKRRRNINQNANHTNWFEELPDDLIIVIMSILSASADSPSDIINFCLSCKRFNEFRQHPWVLAKASTPSLSLRAKHWSDMAHNFLKMCVDAGNMDASYILGMIDFYCLKNRRRGACYMAKAAMNSHPSALFSLAIILFNGSGGSKSNTNLPMGVTLCAHAAQLGHVDAIRELGYCLQDGYGIRPDLVRSRLILWRATALELSCYGSNYHNMISYLNSNSYIQVMDPHPANRFLMEWWKFREEEGEKREEGIQACSHVLCGRVETRRHEFRRCSVCCKAYYCSRACQEKDWKRTHKKECVSLQLQWLLQLPGEGGPLVNDILT